MSRADAVIFYLSLSAWGVIAVAWLVGRLHR